MKTTMQILVFRVADQHFALPLSNVHRVVAAVAVTALPGAPQKVLGFIDLHGALVPVLDPLLPVQGRSTQVRADQQFLIVDAGTRPLALVVDSVRGVEVAALAPLPSTDPVVVPPLPYAGIIRLDDGLVLIHDVERFLSHSDAEALDGALARAVPCAEEGA